MSIGLRVTVQSILGLVSFAALLFLPAGTFNYWQAWVFLAVFVVASLPTVFMVKKDPAALERRMHAGPVAETRTVQKVVAAGVYVVVAALLVFCALDHRFGWSPVPAAVSLAGDALVAAGLGIAIFTVIENRYAAATITVEEGQTVVSTGLYGLVRHPMYMGSMIMMAGIPLALDSWWGLVVLIPCLLGFGFRIRDEETMLINELNGYREYTQKVQHRLVPHVW
jgi:protein-S-isoprenylcysteine O-methyltransferase Ste14